MTMQQKLINKISNKEATKKLIKNRFGEFEINLDKKIFFFNGLLGMPGYINFCLTTVPGINKHFKILQSTEDNDVAFITMPLLKDENGDFPIIENKDVDSLISELRIDEENIVILLVANFVRNGDNINIYVNARAPLVLDVKKLAGIQHVFSSNKYNVRQKLTSNKNYYT